MPAIHPQVCAGHVRARIADQEHGGAAVLVRGRQAVQHVLGWPLRRALGELHKEVCDHGRQDVAGGDGVDADVVDAPLGGEVARELEDGGLGGVVGRAYETLVRNVRR